MYFIEELKQAMQPLRESRGTQWDDTGYAEVNGTVYGKLNPISYNNPRSNNSILPGIFDFPGFCEAIEDAVLNCQCENADAFWVLSVGSNVSDADIKDEFSTRDGREFDEDGVVKFRVRPAGPEFGYRGYTIRFNIPPREW